MLSHVQDTNNELRIELDADPDDSEDDAQSDSSEMDDSYEVPFVPDTDDECVTVHSK